MLRSLASQFQYNDYFPVFQIRDNNHFIRTKKAYELLIIEMQFTI